MSFTDAAPVRENERGITILKFFTKFKEKVLEVTETVTKPETVIEEVQITDAEGNPTGAVRKTEKTIQRSEQVITKKPQIVAEDWVLYAPFGNEKYTQIPEPVRLVQARPEEWARYYEPKYLKFKAGQDLPEEGTPFAAWAGITPEQSDILKVQGIRTVEDLAKLNDSMMERVAFPGVRALVQSAKAFVNASNTRVAASELAARDQKIDAMQAQIEALMEQLSGTSAEPERRGPGRPKKEA